MSDTTTQQPTYSVGIDLGTTHSVLAWVDLRIPEENREVNILPIPQLSNNGQIEALDQLPSFIYQANSNEFPENSLLLPWSITSDTATEKQVAGEMARRMGAKTPIKLVSSAKSWLSHPTINPESSFLPLNSPEEIPKISPVEATRIYLEHLKSAWGQYFPEFSLVEQQITLTVPASFAPGARDLTARTARECGFQHLTLLEEPQAALYSWLQKQGEDWRHQLSVGDCLLVIDIGGGTTDFSLISVTEENGNLLLNRIAVGDHILLGGDNMDLALAYRVKTKLSAEGKELQPWQIQGIVQTCREAKEKLLTEPDLDCVPIVIPARGSRLLGGMLRSELTQQEVQDSLIEGFFPTCDIDTAPKQTSRSALTQKGLPFAQDPAISHHLAAFLTKQRGATEGLTNPETSFIRPTAVLLNGGVLKANPLRDRLLAIINNWLDNSSKENFVKVLSDTDLDLAVGYGAAYFGAVKLGKGVRIRGGIASSYYVGVESAMPAIPGMDSPMEALCIAPFGMEEGETVSIPSETFGLVVGEPVHFKFMGSTTRRDDKPGDRLDHWESSEMETLPEIHALLSATHRKPGDWVSVSLSAHVTEVGTLQLKAHSTDSNEQWDVEFDVRK